MKQKVKIETVVCEHFHLKDTADALYLLQKKPQSIKGNGTAKSNAT